MIEGAVAAAEAQTRCEIVPVVATASGRYDRAEDIVGVWLAMAGAVIVHLLLPQDAGPGGWNAIPWWGEIVVLVITMLLCFIAGVVAASRFAVVRRLFTPRQELIGEVNARARQLFFDRRVHHTEGRSGILIYVSLFEHRAAVLGDRAIVAAHGQAFLDDLCARLTTALHEGSVADAICSTIDHAAGLLGETLPPVADDTNELPDTLVLID